MLSRRALLVALCSFTLLAADVVRGEEPKPPVVGLTIDYGDGASRTYSVPWQKGMTVLDAMEAAKRHPRPIDFAYRGNGDTAFVQRIDDLTNQGGGAGKKNWLYLVNDRFADKGMGVRVLAAGDTVMWQFTYRERK